MKHEKRNDGILEGVARGVSQACVYGLEARKTMIQVYGPKAARVPWQQITKGIFESACTSGFVFSIYFGVRNQLQDHMLSGAISACAASVIKIPISNSMRLLQAQMAPNVMAAATKIMRAKGVPGLYSGYTATLLEDMIELDMRTRLYDTGKNMYTCQTHKPLGIHEGMVLGGICGMIASFVTTPMDTVKAHLAVQAAASKGTSTNAFRVAANICKKEGVRGLYRGARFRASSNGIKGALFYLFLEFLEKHNHRALSPNI